MAAAFRRARYPFENMTAPCAIEKVRRRRRCFSLFSIQFDDASNDCFKDIQVRSSETYTQLKAPKPRLDEHAISQNVTTRLNSSTMSIRTCTSLLIVRRSPYKLGSTIHSTLSRRNQIRFESRCARSVDRNSPERKRDARHAKTLSVLGESLEPPRSGVGNERRDDFFAPPSAKAPETAKLEPRSSLGSQGSVRFYFF
jgi:hypothetical protein